jgi:ABC-2 type transport system permease protein
MLYLVLVELKLLLRRRITAVSVVVVPLGLAALTFFGDAPADEAGWGRLLATNFLLLTMLSAFLVSLTVFTARRQSLVLKRLRTSSLPDPAILAGVVAPVAVVGLAQTIAYLAFCVATGAPVPSPVPVVLGVVLGVAVATAAGVATACLSRSVEVTQLTGTPVLLAAIVGMFLTASPNPALAALGLAMPLAGPADLVARGWSAGLTIEGVPVVPLDVVSALLWLVAAAVVFRRTFHWEPRQ